MARSDELTSQISGLIGGRTAERERQQADLRKQYGIDDRMRRMEGLRKSILDTENALSNLPRDISTRTSGRLMTSAQRNRLLAKESNPLSQSLGSLSRTEELGNSGIRDLQGQINDIMGSRNADFNSQLNDLIAQRNQAWSTEGQERDRAFNERINQMQINARRAEAAAQAAAERDRNNRLLQFQKELQDRNMTFTAPNRNPNSTAFQQFLRSNKLGMNDPRVRLPDLPPDLRVETENGLDFGGGTPQSNPLKAVGSLLMNPLSYLIPNVNEDINAYQSGGVGGLMDKYKSKGQDYLKYLGLI